MYHNTSLGIKVVWHHLSSDHRRNYKLGFHRLMEHIYKVNFDAAFQHDKQGAHLGVVVRDYQGAVVAWETSSIPFLQCPEETEACAARLAISLVHKLHLRRVIIEVDCLWIIQQLHQPTSSTK